MGVLNSVRFILRAWSYFNFNYVGAFMVEDKKSLMWLLKAMLKQQREEILKQIIGSYEEGYYRGCRDATDKILGFINEKK